MILVITSHVRSFTASAIQPNAVELRCRQKQSHNGSFFSDGSHIYARHQLNIVSNDAIDIVIDISSFNICSNGQ